MSSVIVKGSSAKGDSTVRMDKMTTGANCFMDAILTDAKNIVAVAHVTFCPGGGTNWHTHEHGQILQVIQGSGWVCDKGGRAQRISAGDMIWAEAGTTHWHGADDGTIMTHLAIGIGKTEWGQPVSDEEYRQKE